MELVLVQPMTAIHGYITYFDYVKASNKGASKVGDLIVNPFRNGKVDPNYTSGTVEENVALADSKLNLKWCPVVPGSVHFEVGDDKYFDDGQGHIFKGTFASKRFVGERVGEDGRLEGQAGRFDVDPGEAVQVGTIAYGFAGTKEVAGPIYDGANKAVITFSTAPVTEDPIEVDYLYNNIAIVQDDIPQITVVTKGIYLMAKARRIGVTYSQIAAFQAKQEYGQNLAANLEKVAVGTLKYEIDTEIVNLLVNNATFYEDLQFNITPRTGVSLSQHLEGLEYTLETARQKVYDKTQKFQPNYMIIARDVLNSIKFLKGWKGANISNVNGPFFAGSLDELKVYVTPNIAPGTFVLGVNGNDYGTSAAVYAPYMSIVPSQLLSFPDGTNTQGWATMYALELLNKDLLVAGKLYAAPQAIEVTAGE